MIHISESINRREDRPGPLDADALHAAMRAAGYQSLADLDAEIGYGVRGAIRARQPPGPMMRARIARLFCVPVSVLWPAVTTNQEG
jgi:hypothetical protein